MRKVRFAIILSIVVASFSMPASLSAASASPKSLIATQRVSAGVASGSTKTISVSMPWRANMAGLSFTTPAHSAKGVSMSLRAHTADGWSAWEPLEQEDIGADGAERTSPSARVATEPVWIGTADAVDVTLSVAKGARAIHDVRVFLTNTLGDAKPQSLAGRAVHAIGSFLSARAQWGQAADAATSQPAIIPRSGWGPNPKYLNLPCPGTASELKMAFVHHTDTTNSYTKSQAAGLVRGIYNYHTNSRGYCDIAYNFLVDKYGQIFEGRMGGITNNVIGAHTLGFNRYTVGIALLGTYSTTSPTSAEYSALERLLAWRLDIAHIPAVGKVAMVYRSNVKWKYGTTVYLNRISGHRDGYPTSCPGTKVYSALPTVRTKARSIGLPKIYLPALSTNLLRPDADGVNDAVRVTATFSTTVHWTLAFVDGSHVGRRILTGTGSSLNTTWDGKTSTGWYAPTSVYRWTLSAVDSAGHKATPATGVLFVVTSHPNGTLLKDTSGRFELQTGAERSVDDTTLLSYGSPPVISTGPDERGRYVAGTALPLREGTLLVDPSGNHYIWSDATLREFDQHPTDTYVVLFGSTPALSASQEYINSLPAGPPVNDDSIHPDGSAVKDPVTGIRYVVSGGSRRPLTALAFASWYKPSELVEATAGDMLLPVGAGFPVRDGVYIKATDGGAPWLVSDGQRRRFYSTTLATYMGYAQSMLVTASTADINAIPAGARIG